MPDKETPEQTPEAVEPKAPEAAAAPEPKAAAAAPAEVVAPKERRRRAKATKAAKVPVAKPSTPVERHEARIAVRAAKAKERRRERERSRAKTRAVAHNAEPTPPRERAPGTQKTRQGIVVSDRADKTITVRIDLIRRHRRYQKIVATSRTLHAHDEANDAHIGDTVVVRESRPLSRTKRWRLVEVVERAK
jgi:small subunit ribosomal protein S17